MCKLPAVICFSIISTALVKAIEEPYTSSSRTPYVAGNILDSSTTKPPDLSRHRAIPAPVSPPVLFSPQPYLMNPKPQDLHTSSSADYAFTYTGGSSGYEAYAHPTVYDHHMHHGNDHLYHMEESGHHHEDRQAIGFTARDIALGFLSFMIILSTLQGATLNLMRNPNIVSIMPAGRRRRNVFQPLPISEISENVPFNKISEDSGPLAEDKHVRHARQKICTATKNVAEVFGIAGSSFGHYVSDLVSRSEANGWARLVADAGSDGLTGADCRLLYA